MWKKSFSNQGKTISEFLFDFTFWAEASGLRTTFNSITCQIQTSQTTFLSLSLPLLSFLFFKTHYNVKFIPFKN